jgi:hypothetical protein
MEPDAVSAMEDTVVETIINSVETIVKNWGVEAMHQMRSIEIHVQGHNQHANEATKEALSNAVKILKGGNVSKLMVKWEGLYTLQGIWCGNGMQDVLEEIWQSARREDGSRNTQGKIVESWALSERILEPVLEMRPVPEVAVVGCVTDQWAEWLEQYLKSDYENIPEFVRQDNER